MKILLSWLLDHIDCKMADISVQNLVHLFNIRTAEIESFQAISFDKKSLFLTTINDITSTIQTFCPELDQTINMPIRTDAKIGNHYLITRKTNEWSWMSLADCYSSKDGLMPAINVSAEDILGTWKNHISEQDFVFEVDNKSINHRPDLWGHHGIAREIAAFLNLKLKTLDEKLAKSTIFHDATIAQSSDLTVEIQNDQACSRIAATSCNAFNKDSNPLHAFRLALVDIKPMNSIVDLTNFVMLDIGHPMHAFDAKSFSDKIMIARTAQNNETLDLLDGTSAILLNQDVVIANSTQALSLAGVMGGKQSSIQPETTNIIIEAAGLNPAFIRKTAQRLKLRTESCTRFEKHLDPMQNITALNRFLFEAQKQSIIGLKEYTITSAGTVIQPTTHKLDHKTIEKKLGNTLESSFVMQALKKLNFDVHFDSSAQTYEITVPTQRLTKDITIQDDLIEEVVRSYGFENIQSILPERPTQPFDLTIMTNINKIKQYLAFGMQMHEIKEYLMYDAAFIQKLPINTASAIKVKNPMSQNWTTLTTSLIPHLLKAVDNNQSNYDQLKFFEMNRIWPNNNIPFTELQSIAGIIFNKKNVDFYESKQLLSGLFDSLGVSATFKKPTQTVPTWYHAYQTAEIFINDHSIGFAGILSAAWMKPIGAGSAFIFELDAAPLEKTKISTKKFKQWSKFQDIHYDISLLIPNQLTIQKLIQAILNSDSKIQMVNCVDFIEKPEWPDQRAVTLRYIMNDETKTMTKEEIDLLVKKVENVALEYNAKIR